MRGESGESGESDESGKSSESGESGESEVQRTLSDLQDAETHDIYQRQAYALSNLFLQTALFLLVFCQDFDCMMSSASLSTFYANVGRFAVCVLMFTSVCALNTNFVACDAVFLKYQTILFLRAVLGAVRLLIAFETTMTNVLEATILREDSFAEFYDKIYENTKLHYYKMVEARDLQICATVMWFLSFVAMLQSIFRDYQILTPGDVLTKLFVTQRKFAKGEELDTTTDKEYIEAIQERPPTRLKPHMSALINVCLFGQLIGNRALRMCHEHTLSDCAKQILDFDFEQVCILFLSLCWMFLHNSWVHPMTTCEKQARRESIQEFELKPYQAKDLDYFKKTICGAWCALFVLSLQFGALLYEYYYFAHDNTVWTAAAADKIHVGTWSFLNAGLWCRNTAIGGVAIAVYFVCMNTVAAAHNDDPVDLRNPDDPQDAGNTTVKTRQLGVRIGRWWLKTTEKVPVTSF